jgi:hypothetical protein
MSLSQNLLPSNVHCGTMAERRLFGAYSRGFHTRGHSLVTPEPAALRSFTHTIHTPFKLRFYLEYYHSASPTARSYLA